MGRNVILKAPTHIELTITEKCNHKCHHCYNAWREASPKCNSIDIEKSDFILNQLIANRITYVTLTGGEPLMALDQLYWFIQELQKANIGIGLNTNLSLMTNDIAQKLVNEFGWENTILTSLPGFSENECDDITQVIGSFKRIETGIDICIKHGIPVGVNVVITKENLGNLNNLYRFLDKHPISVLALTRVVPPVYNSNESKFILNRDDINTIVCFLRQAKEKYGIRVTSLCSLPFCLLDDKEDANLLSTKCAAGIIGCSINGITGSVTPCAHNEQSYGNIYKEPLEVIWRKMKEWRSGKHIPDECKTCNMLPACGGDCRLNSIRVLQKPYQLDGSCVIDLKKQETKIIFDSNAMYAFNQKTILREEDFGAVVSLGVSEFYVTKPVYQLLKYMQSIKHFGKVELEEICNLNAITLKMLSQWIQEEIIYRIDKK